MTSNGRQGVKYTLPMNHPTETKRADFRRENKEFSQVDGELTALISSDSDPT